MLLKIMSNYFQKEIKYLQNSSKLRSDFEYLLVNFSFEDTILLCKIILIRLILRNCLRNYSINCILKTNLTEIKNF